jgi:hypothetical protein
LLTRRTPKTTGSAVLELNNLFQSRHDYPYNHDVIFNVLNRHFGFVARLERVAMSVFCGTPLNIQFRALQWPVMQSGTYGSEQARHISG